MSEAEPPKPETPPPPGPRPAPGISAPPRRVHWTFISIALFSIGLLIAIPSGLCTLVLGGTIFINTPGDLPMILMIGGLPFLVGFALIVAGLNTRRRDD